MIVCFILWCCLKAAANADKYAEKLRKENLA